MIRHITDNFCHVFGKILENTVENFERELFKVFI